MSSRVWCSVVSLDYRFLKAFMTPNSTGRVVFTVIHPKPNKTDRHIKRFKILELEVNNFYFRKFKPFVARTVVLMRKIFFSLCREKMVFSVYHEKFAYIWRCISLSRNRCKAFGWNFNNHYFIPYRKPKSGQNRGWYRLYHCLRYLKQTRKALT